MEMLITFDNNSVDKYSRDLLSYFTWSENNFEDGDLMRNMACTFSFEHKLQELRIFGADVESGSYEDNGFLRIGFAKINNHEFIKNSKFNYKKLINALWEIAHPVTNYVDDVNYTDNKSCVKEQMDNFIAQRFQKTI